MLLPMIPPNIPAKRKHAMVTTIVQKSFLDGVPKKVTKASSPVIRVE